mmetsp:Transcript_7538/g.19136  ORF Transcript_7538/g.19136 Transcript_7538/m.19136 type:complete len:437 (-) Transcript_7538:289-1599(-)
MSSFHQVRDRGHRSEHGHHDAEEEDHGILHLHAKIDALRAVAAPEDQVHEGREEHRCDHHQQAAGKRRHHGQLVGQAQRDQNRHRADEDHESYSQRRPLRTQGPRSPDRNHDCIEQQRHGQLHLQQEAERCEEPEVGGPRNAAEVVCHDLCRVGTEDDIPQEAERAIVDEGQQEAHVDAILPLARRLHARANAREARMAREAEHDDADRPRNIPDLQQSRLAEVLIRVSPLPQHVCGSDHGCRRHHHREGRDQREVREDVLRHKDEATSNCPEHWYRRCRTGIWPHQACVDAIHDHEGHQSKPHLQNSDQVDKDGEPRTHRGQSQKSKVASTRRHSLSELALARHVHALANPLRCSSCDKDHQHHQQERRVSAHLQRVGHAECPYSNHNVHQVEDGLRLCQDAPLVAGRQGLVQGARPLPDLIRQDVLPRLQECLL